MVMKKIPWATPDIGRKEKDSIIKVLNSDWLSQGQVTEKLEQEICKFVGCKHAVLTNNGTSALICALLSHNIGPGDEVIVPSFTFVASVNSILAVGAKPVLVDCDEKTFNTELDFFKHKITKKTKCILPVDVSGMSVDIKQMRDFAKDQDLILIEDAAESMGGEYDNRKTGSFGHTTIFSFHMAKIITGIEGGCIVTNNSEISKKAKLIRSHGDKGGYNSVSYGLNFRISDIHSAIVSAQLKRIKEFLDIRQEMANKYKEELNLDFQFVPDYVSLHPYFLFSILVPSKIRNSLVSYLNKNNIDVRTCWPPVHTQPYFLQQFGKMKLKNSEKLFSKIINLPMGNKFNRNDQSIVIEKIQKFLKTH